MAQSEACVIGPETRINGRVSGQGGLVVRGHVEGAIAISDGLDVDTGGVVVADVEARTVVVRGTLNGNVVAAEAVRIEEGARVVGDLRTPRIAIAEGATFRGRIDMDVPLPDDVSSPS